MRFTILFILLGAIFPGAVRSDQIVFFVRHAEKAPDTSGRKDPDISEAGQKRAERLAEQLKDANIRAIFVSEFKRTQETAAPLAKLLSLTPIITPAKDKDSLVAQLRGVNGNALVIGHGDTIPDIIRAIGIGDAISIPDQDYDELFEVVLCEKPQLIRLHQSK